jgi:hypothetical protein
VEAIEFELLEVVGKCTQRASQHHLGGKRGLPVLGEDGIEADRWVLVGNVEPAS